MDKYLDRIKRATNRQQLLNITYEAFKDIKLSKKQDDMLTACAVWKEVQFRGEKDALDECAKQLKIPTKYIKAIQ